MGGSSSKKAGSILSDTLGGISDVSGRVGEIANNPYVSKVGSLASMAGSLSGHPEIGMAITGIQHGAHILSDITGELSGKRNKQKIENEVNYPTRYQPITRHNNPIFNRRIGELQERQNIRNAIGDRNFSNPIYSQPLGRYKKTWSPYPI